MITLYYDKFNCSLTDLLFVHSQRPYNQFVTELIELAKSASMVLIPSQFVYTGGSSYAVYNAVRIFTIIMEFSNLKMIFVDTGRKEVIENLASVDDESHEEHS